MKTGTTELIKFKKLARTLQLRTYEAIGLLELLWHVTQRNAIAGDLGRFSNEEIAIELDWHGDADALIAALVACGWLDECPTHRLVVHDWEEHCPNYLKGAMARHNKNFAANGTEQPAKPIEQPASNVTVPNRTLPTNVRKLDASTRGKSLKERFGLLRELVDDNPRPLTKLNKQLCVRSVVADEKFDWCNVWEIARTIADARAGPSPFRQPWGYLKKQLIAQAKAGGCEWGKIEATIPLEGVA